MNPNPSLNSDEKKDNNFFVAPLATLSESEKEFPNISLISSNTENNNGKLSALNKRYLKCTLNTIDDDFYLKNIPFELKNFEEDDSSEDIDSKVLTKIYDNNGHPWLYNNDLNSNKNILNNKRNREETKNLDNDNNDDKRLTDFFNQYVLKSINDALKKSGYKFSFEAFPQNFSEESQKNLFQLTLEDIFTKKELYEQEDIKTIFEPNYEVLKELRSDDKYKNIMEQTGLEKKLSMKISNLYQEYLDSNNKL